LVTEQRTLCLKNCANLFLPELDNFPRISIILDRLQGVGRELVNLLHTFPKIKSSPKTSKNQPTVSLDVDQRKKLLI